MDAILRRMVLVFGIVVVSYEYHYLRCWSVELGQVASGTDTAVWEPESDDSRGVTGQLVPRPLPEERGEGLSRGTVGSSEVNSPGLVSYRTHMGLCPVVK